MKSFRVSIDKVSRQHWYKLSLAYEWTYYGSRTIKLKLQETRDGWTYCVRHNGGANYVITMGQPVPNPNSALLSGILWVERNYARPLVPKPNFSLGTRLTG